MSSGDRRDDEPARLRDSLAEVGAELGLPRPGVVDALQARWPDAVGAEVAGHTYVAALRAGVLTVVVDAAPWATRLRYQEADLVRWANRVTGAAALVTGVRVRVESGG